MIIEIPNENSIVKWKNDEKDEWKVAEISDLIKAYERPQVTVFAENASKEEIEDFKQELEKVLERPQDCSNCKRYDSPYFEIKIDKEQMQELVDKAKAEILASIERPQSEWVGNAFDEHHCKRCGHPALWEEEPDDYYEVQSNFCPNCGADMRKPNCVTCDHFGKCEGCEKRDEE